MGETSSRILTAQAIETTIFTGSKTDVSAMVLDKIVNIRN